MKSLRRNLLRWIGFSATAIVVLCIAAYSPQAFAGEQNEKGQQSSERQLVLIDPDLELEVREALSEDPAVESHEVTVIVERDEVYLYGAVDSEREKELAEKVASQVEGIVKVNNQITVAIWPSSTDKKDLEIETSIREALTEAFGQQADAINVFVEHGMATLEGVVQTRSQLRRAIETAFASGAVLVKNSLEVRDEARKRN
jgi:osmotically-inducible protein OsmY